MSEEQLELIEEEEVNVEQEETIEVSPGEEQALNRGWKPEEDWEGEPDGWVSAAEFNRRGELMGKIASQNRKIQELENSYVDIANHYKKVQETEYERALVNLKERKKEALDNDDTDTIVEVDDAIQDLKKDYTDTKEDSRGNEQPTSSSEYLAWQEVNSWYNSDFELTPVADGIAKAYMQRAGSGVTEAEVLDFVANEVRERYPEKFGMNKRSKQTVSGSPRTTRAKKSSKKATRGDLDDTQKSIMDGFVRAGVMTEEQYINDLIAIGDLK